MLAYQVMTGNFKIFFRKVFDHRLSLFNSLKINTYARTGLNLKNLQIIKKSDIIL